jgi:hypothetical protein
LNKVRPRLIVDALQLLNVQELVIGKLSVELEGVALMLGYGVVIVVNPLINDIPLMSGCLFAGGFYFERF